MPSAMEQTPHQGVPTPAPLRANLYGSLEPSEGGKLRSANGGGRDLASAQSSLSKRADESGGEGI